MTPEKRLPRPAPGADTPVANVTMSRNTIADARHDLASTSTLASIDAARQALTTLDCVSDVKTLGDKARAIADFARNARDTALFEKATRLFLEAERRAGQLLDAMTLANGGDAQRTRFQKGTESPPTLASLGITKKQSMRWQRLAHMPLQEFDSHIGSTTKRVVSAASHADDTAIRRAERMRRIVELCAGNAPLGALMQRYPVIYADPPWQYEHVKTESRAVENHYPTMTLDEIKALPVTDVAFDDCVLFLWTTAPKLGEAFDVLAAWGFTYRTFATWDKQKIGMGYYFRQQTEPLLLAVKGSPPAPAPDARPASLFSYPRGAHSAKPVEVYDMIERMYPDLPKLELFARAPRDGWAAWGNQAGDSDDCPT